MLEAERLYLKLLAWHAGRGTLESAAATEVQLRLSVALTSIGDPAGEGLARSALAVRVRTLGATNRDTEIARMVLASAILNFGEKSESRDLILKTFQSLAGDEAAQKDPVVRAVLEHMRALVVDTLSPRLAEAALIKSCQLMEEALGPGHLYLALPKGALASVLHKNGKSDKAEAQFRDCLAIIRKTVGVGHPQAVELFHNYANVAGPRGGGREAWKLIDEAYTCAKEKYSDEFRWRYRIVCVHGHYAGRMGLTDVLLRDVEDAIAMMGRLERPLTEGEQRRFSYLVAGTCHLDDLPQIRDLHARIVGPHGPVLGDAARELIDHYRCWYLYLNAQYADAEPLLRTVVGRPRLPRTHGPVVSAESTAPRATSVGYLSKCCWRSGRFEEAEKWMREAVLLEMKEARPERASQAWSSLMDLLILRQKWAAVSAAAGQHPSPSGQPPTDRSRLALVRAAASAFGPSPQAKDEDLEGVERLFGKSTDLGVTLHRARIVLLLGGDLKRERDRLAAFLPADAAIAEMRGRFEIALGNFAVALVDPKASGTPASDEARHRLHRLLSAYATAKTGPSPETEKALAAELVEVDKYLAATPDLSDPTKAAASIGLVLELHFWSRKIRVEGK